MARDVSQNAVKAESKNSNTLFFNLGKTDFFTFFDAPTSILMLTCVAMMEKMRHDMLKRPASLEAKKRHRSAIKIEKT